MSENIDPQTPLGALAENVILERIFPRLPRATAALVGPGDDCAVIAAPDGRFVVTSDMMVQGPDFRLEYSTGHDLGVKAAATNLADVAAMGAHPTALVVSIAAPPSTPIGFMEEVADGFRDACEKLAPGCGVVGGDLSVSSVLTVSVTAFGNLEGREPVLRSGAQAGDVLAVAGELGLAAAGLAELFHGRSPREPLRSAQLAPTPPIASGVAAALAGATAGLDLSDSLALDAARIARASGVVLELESARLDPFVTRLSSLADLTPARATELVLTGGEDHALLMTFPATATLPSEFVVIGAVRALAPGEAPHLELGGSPLAETGWNPFSGWDGTTS